MKKNISLLFSLLMSCYTMVAQNASTPTITAQVDASSVVQQVNKGKVLNVARGGQTINLDRTWMPKFYDKLSSVGIESFRIDMICGKWFYGVTGRDADGRLVCDFDRLDEVILPLLKCGITPVMCFSAVNESVLSSSIHPDLRTEHKYAERRRKLDE